MEKKLRLILGDQLNEQHSWFSVVDDSVTYLMMEIRQETDYVNHHIQKIVAFFNSMRAFAAQLEQDGHRVIYYRLDDKQNRQDLTQNIDAVVKSGGFTIFEYLLPDEYRLDQQLLLLRDVLEVEVKHSDTEHFLTQRDDLKKFFGKKNYLMETFYRNIRKENGWLMEEDGKPEGGKWNYDKENRKALPKDKEVAEPLMFNHDVSDLVRLISLAGVKTIGNIDPQNFIWPANRKECLELLHFFLQRCLADYGKYQDALHSDYWSLFHARISFSLNSKMLHPREVVEAAIDHYRSHRDVSLAAIEGFVRQIVGWREFMRGVYWAKMPEYSSLNELNNQNPLPAFYWTGETRMACLKHAISQSLDYAYAHHIQRLMVTGNFALLAGVHPDYVDEWYLGIYIDAIEWVEITNTRGMSQFADGGIFATKPYISSANYINKMSNYCPGCYYDHKEKYTKSACPFNSLYWYFLIQHKEKLERNHRMRMMYSRLANMEKAEKSKLIKQAEHNLKNIDNL